MEKRPNQWKIPAKAEPVIEEAPANVPENILFGLLGAWCALLLGLALYQEEIQARLNIDRKPASMPVAHDVTDPTGFNPYENFPSLFI
jgi:hypothetical protein